MADYTKYTKQEMQAYAIAKNIKENQIVIVGTGLPLIGASLATVSYTHLAPGARPGRGEAVSPGPPGAGRGH